MDVKNTNVKPWPKQGLSEHVRAAPAPVEPRPSREQAEAAVRTLIAYTGDDPTREGVLETPKRVIDAYAPTGLAEHRAPEPGGEHPLMQAMPGMTEWGFEREALARAEPIE